MVAPHVTAVHGRADEPPRVHAHDGERLALAAARAPAVAAAPAVNDGLPDPLPEPGRAAVGAAAQRGGGQEGGVLAAAAPAAAAAGLVSAAVAVDGGEGLGEEAAEGVEVEIGEDDHAVDLAAAAAVLVGAVHVPAAVEASEFDLFRPCARLGATGLHFYHQSSTLFHV